MKLISLNEDFLKLKKTNVDLQMNSAKSRLNDNVELLNYKNN